MTVAATSRPARVLSAEQEAAMLRRERVVLDERIRGRSFHLIEKTHDPHRDPARAAADGCDCGGLQNADRIWRRAVARDENASFRRAEAIRLEEGRLDALQDGIWDRAVGGEPRAVEVALKVLERRARMHGLDFADMVSGQLVEVERAKVKLLATALVTALRSADLSPEQSRAVTAAFFEEVRKVATEAPPALLARPDEDVHDAVLAPDLAPEDRDLL